jgi:hypothetical protein
MQEITNRAVLTQTANRTKSNLLAEDYLDWVKERFPNALKLQCIPEDRELWKLENFEGFLQARRKILSDQLNLFLTGITETVESVVETPIEDIISKGESKELEFKSSLRWDISQAKVNPFIEFNIVKAIAAFCNADGGTLLIGVNDEGEVIGLDNDYGSLKGSKDEFELHLRNLVKKNFDAVFSASNVEISFPKIDGIEMCRVDLKRSTKPVFIITQDRNGQKIEKFYVRSGNTSQEFKPSEIGDYISNHFNISR